MSKLLELAQQAALRGLSRSDAIKFIIETGECTPNSAQRAFKQYTALLDKYDGDVPPVSQIIRHGGKREKSGRFPVYWTPSLREIIRSIGADSGNGVDASANNLLAYIDAGEILVLFHEYDTAPDCEDAAVMLENLSNDYNNRQIANLLRGVAGALRTAGKRMD